MFRIKKFNSSESNNRVKFNFRMVNPAAPKVAPISSRNKPKIAFATQLSNHQESDREGSPAMSGKLLNHRLSQVRNNSITTASAQGQHLAGLQQIKALGNKESLLISRNRLSKFSKSKFHHNTLDLSARKKSEPNGMGKVTEEKSISVEARKPIILQHGRMTKTLS
jgi:hypothetical protein